jgi:hypothetical protein
MFTLGEAVKPKTLKVACIIWLMLGAVCCSCCGLTIVECGDAGKTN